MANEGRGRTSARRDAPGVLAMGTTNHIGMAGGRRATLQKNGVDTENHAGGGEMNNTPWQTQNNEANTAPATAADALALFNSAPEQAETASGPIPAGRYLARLESGGLEQSGRGNWCYAARWMLTGGPYDGRRLVSRHWVTPAAVARTKQELGALGLTAAHLQGGPLPEVLAELSVKARADECGDIFNEVKRVTLAKAALKAREDVQDGAQGANAGGGIQTPCRASGTPETPSMDTGGGDDAAFLDDEFGGVS